MGETANSKKLQQILIDLTSSDEKKVLKAIKSLEIHGDTNVIPCLMDRLLNGAEKGVEFAIMELLSSLKDSSAKVEIMAILEKPEYLTIRQKVLSTIWNMKVDFSDYIAEFVEIAVQGDFMEALECLTIIENMEGPFMEEDILESQLHLKTYLESNDRNDTQKAQILSEIALKIKEINSSLTD